MLYEVITLGMALGDVGAGEHDLGAHRLEIGDLLAAHLVGDHEDQPVALLRRYQREAQAGVSRGPFDQDRAGTNAAGGLSLLDHPQADAVLDGAAGVLALELDEQLAGTGFEA